MLFSLSESISSKRFVMNVFEADACDTTLAIIINS